jgi:hypothetical protein
MRMEPFYQLAESQEDRALLTHSFAFSYTTSNALTVPFHALKRKQWAVFYSSVSHLIASIVLPTLATEIMSLAPFVDPSLHIRLRSVFLWTKIASLAAILLLTGCLIRLLCHRRSGVKANP